jgi:hypothetical protein
MVDIADDNLPKMPFKFMALLLTYFDVLQMLFWF